MIISDIFNNMFIAQFALSKKRLFAVKRQLDKGVEKRLAKQGNIAPKKFMPTYSKYQIKPEGKLTSKNKYILRSYLDGEYGRINNGKDYFSRYLRSNVDQSLRRIPQQQIPEKPLVRRIAITEEGADRFLGKYKKGTTHTTKRNTSTSQQTKGVRQDLFGKTQEGEQQVKYLIKPKQKTKARYVEPFSNRYDDEGEWLFPSRTKFKTNKVSKTNKGYTINIEEV